MNNRKPFNLSINAPDDYAPTIQTLSEGHHLIDNHLDLQQSDQSPPDTASSQATTVKTLTPLGMHSNPFPFSQHPEQSSTFPMPEGYTALQGLTHPTWIIDTPSVLRQNQDYYGDIEVRSNLILQANLKGFRSMTVFLGVIVSVVGEGVELDTHNVEVLNDGRNPGWLIEQEGGHITGPLMNLKVKHQHLPFTPSCGPLDLKRLALGASFDNSRHDIASCDPDSSPDSSPKAKRPRR